jgi:hypothetical protein
MTTTTRTTTVRRTGVALATGLAAFPLALGVLAPAGAAAPAAARITASVTDSSPASGETFRVSGRLTRGGTGLAGRTVRVQTLRDGDWSNLTGAQMSTSSTGRYNLRLVLGQTGTRTLRVVGVVDGPNPRKRFVVQVH